MVMLTTSTETVEWVRKHQVCWEVQPLKEMVKGSGVRQTGIEVFVYAQHGGAQRLDPTASEHTELFAGLHELAERMLPPGHALAHFAIEPFDASEHLRPETGWVPEVQMRVMITPDDPERAVDKELVAEVERRLHAVGAQPRVWPHARHGRG